MKLYRISTVDQNLPLDQHFDLGFHSSHFANQVRAMYKYHFVAKAVEYGLAQPRQKKKNMGRYMYVEARWADANIGVILYLL